MNAECNCLFLQKQELSEYTKTKKGQISALLFFDQSDA